MPFQDVMRLLEKVNAWKGSANTSRQVRAAKADRAFQKPLVRLATTRQAKHFTSRGEQDRSYAVMTQDAATAIDRLNFFELLREAVRFTVRLGSVSNHHGQRESWAACLVQISYQPGSSMSWEAPVVRGPLHSMPGPTLGRLLQHTLTQAQTCSQHGCPVPAAHMWTVFAVLAAMQIPTCTATSHPLHWKATAYSENSQFAHNASTIKNTCL